VPYAVSVLMIFMAPFKQGSVANAAWVGFFLIAYYTAYTFFFIPRNALIPEVIPDAKDRVGYYGISTAFFMGSSSFMYAATLFVDLIKRLGFSALWSWRIVFTVFAVIGLVCVLLGATAFREKDYVEENIKPKQSLFTSARTIFKNRSSRK
jgi:Na+/melibiose symporter-like transporter